MSDLAGIGRARLVRRRPRPVLRFWNGQVAPRHASQRAARGMSEMDTLLHKSRWTSRISPNSAHSAVPVVRSPAPSGIHAKERRTMWRTTTVHHAHGFQPQRARQTGGPAASHPSAAPIRQPAGPKASRLVPGRRGDGAARRGARARGGARGPRLVIAPSAHGTGGQYGTVAGPHVGDHRPQPASAPAKKPPLRKKTRHRRPEEEAPRGREEPSGRVLLRPARVTQGLGRGRSLK